MQSSEEQIRSKDNIINEYKQITRDLSEKLNNKITTPEERKLGKIFIIYYILINDRYKFLKGGGVKCCDSAHDIPAILFWGLVA